VKCIYAIIPVFNRVDDTLNCIGVLETQTYSNIKIVVVDGGSTDNTPEIIRQTHPNVEVIASEKELWWGGAVHEGIEFAINDSSNGNDFILMVNNDVTFGTDALSILAKTSDEYNGAVCGVVINSLNNRQVLDSGVEILWDEFRFYSAKRIPKNPSVKIDCDVLGGRCTLVPMQAIKKAGNVDCKAFPHYLADYEFTYRLKKNAGIKLCVDYNVRIVTEIKHRVNSSDGGVINIWRSHYKKYSKQNLINRFKFLFRHAPKEYKLKLILKLLLESVISYVPAKIKESTIVRRVYKMLFRTYLVSGKDCSKYNLTPDSLCCSGVLIESDWPGYYKFNKRKSQIKKENPEAISLFWHAWRPDVKILNFYATRMLLRNN
jgi:GT2 family glycosyltransferase